MKELKGTKTEKNLMEAFAGESMARNKYTYFASRAKKDGYVQIASIFEETAANEKEHAKLWYKYLNGGSVGDTIHNLTDAADGENFEWTDMYDRMAREAREEGFDEIAEKFALVGAIEREHEARCLAVRQLWSHRHWQESPRDLSCLQSSPELLPSKGRQLLKQREQSANSHKYSESIEPRFDGYRI